MWQRACDEERGAGNLEGTKYAESDEGKGMHKRGAYGNRPQVHEGIKR